MSCQVVQPPASEPPQMKQSLLSPDCRFVSEKPAVIYSRTVLEESVMQAQACTFRPRCGNSPRGCTGQPPSIKLSGPNVCGAKAEKPCLKRPCTGRSFVMGVTHNCKLGQDQLLNFPLGCPSHDFSHLSITPRRMYLKSPCTTASVCCLGR